MIRVEAEIFYEEMKSFSCFLSTSKQNRFEMNIIMQDHNSINTIIIIIIIIIILTDDSCYVHH